VDKLAVSYSRLGPMASTPVPAVDRALAILRLLSERWDVPKTLSEISRDTGIHKATCAALLARLVSHGCVRRNPEKSYSIGPEMLGMGFSYGRRFPGYVAARTEIFRLAEQTGLTSSICVRDGDEMVILDMAGDVAPSHLPSRIGRRIPLAPPLGTIFKAWSSPEEVREWLSSMATQYELNVDDQIGVISTIRSRGYSLGSEQDFDIPLDAVVRRLSRKDSDLTGISVALMLADKIRAYRGATEDIELHGTVDYIVGPVFDHHGRVMMSLQLMGAPGQIERGTVDSLAATLLESTQRVTERIGGSHKPVAAML
jgi:DNA-binding IclR family transcriptional regulator